MSSLPSRAERKAAARARARRGRLRRWLYRLAAAGVGVAAPALFAPPAAAVPTQPAGGVPPWAAAGWAAAGGAVLLAMLRPAGRGEIRPAAEEGAPSPSPGPAAPPAGEPVLARAEAPAEAIAAPAIAAPAPAPAPAPVPAVVAGAGRPPSRKEGGAPAFRPAYQAAAALLDGPSSSTEGGASPAQGVAAPALEGEAVERGPAPPWEEAAAEPGADAPLSPAGIAGGRRPSTEGPSAFPGEVAAPGAPDTPVWRGPAPAILRVVERQAAGEPLLARPVATPPRRRPGRLAQRKSVLGVDVGSYSTKIVQVRRGRRGFAVVNFWVVPTPSGAMNNGALENPSALAERLAELVGGYRLAGRPATAALGIQKALTRIVKFPPMSEEEIANALRWEADTYVPMPLEGAAVDFLVGSGPPEPDSREMEVLVVAAAREAVDALAAALATAGLRPAAVEVEPLAAYRALRAMGAVPRGDAGLTAVLDLGEAGTRVSVFRHDLPVVSRAVKPGGRDFTEAIARGLRFPLERAEAAKRRWGVREGTPITPLVEGLVEKMLTEIWRSVEFFLVLSRAQRLDRVLLVGGNALQPGLAERVDAFLVRRLGERFGQIPSESGLAHLIQPGARVRLLRHLRGAADELDAQLVTALGLALWKA